MSSHGKIPEVISLSDDSDTVTGCHTPVSEQSNTHFIANGAPSSVGHGGIVDQGISPLPLEGSSVSANKDQMPSANVEGGLDDNKLTEVASQQQDTIYDSEGDITLVVGQGQTQKFLLSSNVLAATSAVWKDLITSAQEGGSRTLHLPDDDPAAVSILLQVAHFRFLELLPFITFQELYSLARLCQKYQVHKLFWPFVRRWTEPFVREGLDPEQPEWLLISWEFRITFIFDSWLDHLCRTAEKDEDGCTVYGGRKLAELFPDACRNEFVELVENQRVSLLSRLTEVCTKGLEKGCCTYKSESLYEEQCNTLMAGYLLTGLRSLGGWPLDPSTARISAEELKRNLLGLQFNPLPVTVRARHGPGSEDHSDCGLHALRHEITSISLIMDTYYPGKTFNHPICDAVVISNLPIMRRAGLHARDFEAIDSESEADENYDSPTDMDTEPDEEFEKPKPDEESEDYTSSEGSDDSDDSDDSDESEDD